MAFEKSSAQKHREAQENKSYRKICSLCARSWYESLVGHCPERAGRQVCMYCCRMCPEHYQGAMGQGCRARDREREQAKKKEQTKWQSKTTPPV